MARTSVEVLNVVRYVAAASGERWDDDRIKVWCDALTGLPGGRSMRAGRMLAKNQDRHPWQPADFFRWYERAGEDAAVEDPRPVVGLLPGETALPAGEAKKRLAEIKRTLRGNRA